MEEEIKQCDGKWNGYYIEASQQAYDLLVADGYISERKFCDMEFDYLDIYGKNKFESASLSFIKKIKFKPLYIADGRLSSEPSRIAKQIENNFLDCDERDLPCEIIEQMNRSKKESKTKELFEECEAIIGDRGQDYGEAKESFSRIAGFWSAYLKIEVSTKDVALMLTLFKIAREQGNKKRDNIVDGINYLALSDQL